MLYVGIVSIEKLKDVRQLRRTKSTILLHFMFYVIHSDYKRLKCEGRYHGFIYNFASGCFLANWFTHCVHRMQLRAQKLAVNHTLCKVRDVRVILDFIWKKELGNFFYNNTNIRQGKSSMNLATFINLKYIWCHLFTNFIHTTY